MVHDLLQVIQFLCGLPLNFVFQYFVIVVIFFLKPILTKRDCDVKTN